MSKLEARLEREDPTIIVKLTPNGMEVRLLGWQHNAPVSQLAGLEIQVQRAIHQWRARFLQRESTFGTPSTREREVNEARSQQ
jgi:hypothetical protein